VALLRVRLLANEISLDEDDNDNDELFEVNLSRKLWCTDDVDAGNNNNGRYDVLLIPSRQREYN
jgi:hypothetical protein